MVFNSRIVPVFMLRLPIFLIPPYNTLYDKDYTFTHAIILYNIQHVSCIITHEGQERHVSYLARYFFTNARKMRGHPPLYKVAQSLVGCSGDSQPIIYILKTLFFGEKCSW